MATSDYLRQGTKRFLDTPALTAIALIGATIDFILGRMIQHHINSFSLSSIQPIIYLSIAAAFVSLLIYSILLSLLEIEQKTDSTIIKHSLRSTPALAVGGLISISATIAGLAFFILPGIYIALRLFLYPFRIVIERESVFTALGSSWDMMKGNIWKSIPPIATVLLIGIASMTVLSTLHQSSIHISSLLHNTFYLPWSLSVFYCLYNDIKT